MVVDHGVDESLAAFGDLNWHDVMMLMREGGLDAGEPEMGLI